MIEKKRKAAYHVTTAFPLAQSGRKRCGSFSWARRNLPLHHWINLVQAGCNIVAVITAPDKPAGRGMQIQQSAVKKYAVEKGLHHSYNRKIKRS